MTDKLVIVVLLLPACLYSVNVHGAPALQNSTSSANINCNFDTNLCGWTQGKNDQKDWIRNHGSTSSAGTGPTNDHTLGNAQGFYIYAEASSPDVPGDKAQLISPVIQPGQKCLSFWYSMHGSTIGSLNVYMKGSSSPLWTRMGNQGHQWIKGNVSLDQKTPYQVMFESVSGTSYEGDIAIDDVVLTDGACSTVPYEDFFECDFQSGICGAIQDKSDDFDWTRSHGSTSSVSTGPTGDHTLGGSGGYYIYTESSSPRRPGDKARLLLPFVQARTAGECLTFWYSMYGATIGALNVYVQTHQQHQKLLWTMEGNQGKQWNMAQVSLPSSETTTPHQIVFEGVVGLSYLGDIALDDITLTKGACTVSVVELEQ